MNLPNPFKLLRIIFYVFSMIFFFSHSRDSVKLPQPDKFKCNLVRDLPDISLNSILIIDYSTRECHFSLFKKFIKYTNVSFLLVNDFKRAIMFSKLQPNKLKQIYYVDNQILNQLRSETSYEHFIFACNVYILSIILRIREDIKTINFWNWPVVYYTVIKKKSLNLQLWI